MVSVGKLACLGSHWGEGVIGSCCADAEEVRFVPVDARSGATFEYGDEFLEGWELKGVAKDG